MSSLVVMPGAAVRPVPLQDLRRLIWERNRALEIRASLLDSIAKLDQTQGEIESELAEMEARIAAGARFE